MRSARRLINSWLLILLVLFLPVSAWLVSFSGNYLLSLGRDLFTIALFLTTIWTIRPLRYQRALSLMTILYIALTFLTFFHREDDFGQWLRGVRFLTEPFILFGLVLQGPTLDQRPIWRALAWITVIVALFGVVDLIWPTVLHYSLDVNGRGYLFDVHFASTLHRIQSLLAGPNALGLYLAMAILTAPLWLQELPRLFRIIILPLVAAELLLTYSRSSYLGAVVGLVVLLALLKRTGRFADGFGKWLLITVIGFVLLVSSLYIWKPGELTRYTSNTLRWEQYERIWQQRQEIGFWGRGAGAAGLVSQFRFDDGDNHYSENSYLDTYEGIGMLGLLSYLAFWGCLLIQLAKCRTLLSVVAIAAVASLLSAGFFINHYTGQAAIWLTLLVSALALQESVDSSGPIDIH